MEEEHLSPLKATKKNNARNCRCYYSDHFLMAAVFIPVAFMSGPVVFYRQFSITMATAIILSGIVALTLALSLCYDVKNNHGALKENTY
jgi:HAE1 family hydrophobic/amphiphilic exporter-1